MTKKIDPSAGVCWHRRLSSELHPVGAAAGLGDGRQRMLHGCGEPLEEA